MSSPGSKSFPKYGDKSANQRRNKQRRYDLELTQIAREEPLTTNNSHKIKQWFSELTLDDRERIVEIENHWFADILRQMHERELLDGRGTFRLKPESSINADTIDIYTLDSTFQYKRLTLLEWEGRQLESDMYFLKSVLLRDIVEYMDTIGLKQQILQKPDGFFTAMDNVSNFQAFKTPCYVIWDPIAKQWIWENPPWLKPTAYNSVAVWVATNIEKNIWMHFAEQHKLDPRRPGEPQPWTWEPFKISQYLQMKHLYIDFWKQLDMNQRGDILRDMEQIFEQFTQERKMLPTQLISLYTQNIFYLAEAATPQNKKPGYYNTPSSIQEITLRAGIADEERFIKFIFCSSLKRAGSALDIVARKISQQIQHKFSEKSAEDLLLTEEAEAIKKEGKFKKSIFGEAKRKSKKRKKKKRRLSDVSVSTTNSVATTKSNNSKNSKDEELDIDSMVAKQVQKSIFKGLYKSLQGWVDIIQEDEREERSRRNSMTRQSLDLLTQQLEQVNVPDLDTFQIVAKRKYKKSALSVKSDTLSVKSDEVAPRVSKPRKVTYAKSAIQKSSPSKKGSIKWDLSQCSEAPEILPDPKEFPPLQTVASKSNDMKLHNEIVDLYDDIMGEYARRENMRRAVYETLTEMAQNLFHGCYLEMFGSQAAGLALPDSDMDIMLLNSNIHNPMKGIDTIQYLLSPEPWVLSIQGIHTASVPIVKLTIDCAHFDPAIQDTLKVDLTFDYMAGTENRGMNSLSIMSELKNRYQILPYLMFVIKKLLRKHGLNNPYHGGLNSYSLVIWITAIISANHADETLNLGQWLLKFLEFYGYTFDPKTTQIWITNADPFVPMTYSTDHVLTVDPVDYTNNISRTSFEINGILKLFADTYETLQNMLEDSKTGEILKTILESI